MKKKQLSNRDLVNYPVAYVDSTPYSRNFFNITEIPNSLTSGKNIIKLKSNPTTMVKGTDIYFEIVDYNNDPIFYEVLDVVENDRSRIISIYIYDDTPSGKAVCTFLGTSKIDGNGRTLKTNKPNIKYSFSIDVNSNKKNSSEIIFTTLPTINVDENIVPYSDLTYLDDRITSQSNGSISYSKYGYNLGRIVSDGFEFTEEMIGGTLLVESPQNSQPPLTTFNTSSNIYKTKINKILNKTTALTDRLYFVSGSDKFKIHNYNSFESSSYSISYIESGSYSQTQDKKSYAVLNFANLSPSTGDVHRVKTYVKSYGEAKNQYDIVDDVEIDNVELLQITGSNEALIDIGKPKNQGWVNQYYETKSLNSEPSASLVYDSNDILNGISLRYTSTITPQQYYILKLKDEYSLDMYRESDYVFSFDAIAKTSTSSSGNPSAVVYWSGSSFNYKNDESEFGTKLGTLYSSQSYHRFENNSFEFNPNRDGKGVFQIKIDSGEWDFSNFSLKSTNEFGYTPNQFIRVFELPQKHRNDRLDFRFEYFNIDNKQSNYFSLITGSFFSGGNYYLQGDDNLITGSTFTGTSTGSGLEHYGNDGGGYFRTAQYTNYHAESYGYGNGGIMIFSGSEDYTSSLYNGIGMEMYTPNGEYGMNFGTQHGYNYRPQYREFFDMSTIPNPALTTGVNRGTVIYGHISHSVGAYSPIHIDTSDNSWRNAGFYFAESSKFYGAQGVNITGETGDNLPILIEGIIDASTISGNSGDSIFVDDTVSGSFITTSTPNTNIQKVGILLPNNMAYVNFMNSPVQSATTGLITS